MANHLSALAAEALAAARAGDHDPPAWRALVETALEQGEPGEQASQVLFREVVEPLADTFDPADVEAYVGLFIRLLERVDPTRPAQALAQRYRRLREPRVWRAPDPARVYVLSRVTLGADVAVTSVVLNAACRRFPNARIVLVASRKAFELFQDDPRLEHLCLTYPRGGGLAARLGASRELAHAISTPDALLIDPDSRLTQLGLVPAAPEQATLFFESRAWQPDSPAPLTTLASRWADLTLGISDARPYLAPGLPPATVPPGAIAISLGVGGNPAKCLPPPFEEELVRALARHGRPLLIDFGAGQEEAARVGRAIRAAGPAAEIHTLTGPFAPFAAAILRSALYVGYDSAGQHVAAAAGVPLVTVFAGAPSARFFSRWRPSGPGPIVTVPAGGRPGEAVLEETLQAVSRLLE